MIPSVDESKFQETNERTIRSILDTRLVESIRFYVPRFPRVPSLISRESGARAAQRIVLTAHKRAIDPLKREERHRVSLEISPMIQSRC